MINPADHFGLVYFVAVPFWRSRTWRNVTKEDVIQHAMAEMVDAARRYDPRKGTFATFAAETIKCSLRGLWLEDRRLVSFCGHNISRMVYRKLHSYEWSNGIDPQTIAKTAGFGQFITDKFTIEEAHRALGFAQGRDVSASSFSDQTERSIEDTIADENATEAITDGAERSEAMLALLACVDRIMADASPLKVALVSRRILAEEPETLEAIARDHGLSRERARQVEQRIIRQLRQDMKTLGYKTAE
jgi:RNA polymerase sigma-32 factor